jgi:hypothetical protein
MITSDHSPWDIAKKSRPDDIFANASGIPGVQTLLPLAYAGVVAGHGLPVLRLAELVAANPVRVFGLAPRKGQLTAGADADLVVLDPVGTTRLHPGGDAVERDLVAVPRHGAAARGTRARRTRRRLGARRGSRPDQTAVPAVVQPRRPRREPDGQDRPVGMLFAPSRDGRSHCPEEWTEP